MQKQKHISLQKEILNLGGKTLDTKITQFLKTNEKVICKGLNRRPVFINEYLFFTNSRNSGDKNHRKRCFFCAIELIKTVKKDDLTNSKRIGGKKSYEFKGETPKGAIVGTHIVEYTNGKDKLLKLVSTFWDNKKT